MHRQDLNDDRRQSVAADIAVETVSNPLASRSKQLRLALMSALMLIGAVSGCVTSDKKCGLEGCSGDAKITSNVEENLGKHPELQGVDRIHVQTVNHVVYLTGQVSEGLQATIAESVARDTQGVTQVENSIYVVK